MKKLLIGTIILWNFLNAFEVNTHQALTRCAITSSCGNGYTQNLYSFVNHGEILLVPMLQRGNTYWTLNLK